MSFLPQALLTSIWEYDSTYRERFDCVLEEIQCPELSALLRGVPEIKKVTYGSDDGIYFSTESGDMYLVVCYMVRLAIADGNLMELVNDDEAEWMDYFQAPYSDLRKAAERYGWPPLLKCEEGFERSVIVRGRKYYVYKCNPDQVLHDIINNNNLYKVTVTRKRTSCFVPQKRFVSPVSQTDPLIRS